MKSQVSQLEVKYDKTLILSNPDIMITVTRLYPQFCYFENIINSKNPVVVNRPQRQYNFLKKANPEPCASENVNPGAPSTNPVTPPIDPTLVSFQADKKCYYKIKADIDNDVIKKEDISPWFIEKYLFFNIMDVKNQLKESNDDINNEFKYFDELKNAALETDSSDDEPPLPKYNNLFGGSDVYVPHNYNYMTDQQKLDYVTRANMTISEFEEKMSLSLC
jgi:hypothetical protein